MPRSFTWRAVEFHDGGKTWQLTEEMLVRESGQTSEVRICLLVKGTLEMLE